MAQKRQNKPKASPKASKGATLAGGCFPYAVSFTIGWGVLMGGAIALTVMGMASLWLTAPLMLLGFALPFFTAKCVAALSIHGPCPKCGNLVAAFKFSDDMQCRVCGKRFSIRRRTIVRKTVYVSRKDYPPPQRKT